MSKNTIALQNHEGFIIEQAQHNEEQQFHSAARVLILKDLKKLPIDLNNKV